MSLAIQHLVDRLAARLGRPAVLEDRFLRLVAYSAHDGPVDSVRQGSILRRHTSAEVSRWLNDVGIREARGPVRVPGNADLDMLPRVCVPIRHRRVLLGYLWFIDAEQSISTVEVDSCVESADELAILIRHENLNDHRPPAHAIEITRRLLSDSPAAATAARELVDHGLIRSDEGVTVAVAQVITGTATTASATQDDLIEALFTSPRLYRRGCVLPLGREDHTALVLAVNERDQAQVRSQLESVHGAASGELGAGIPAATLVVGIGAWRAEMASAYESYLEARMAAMVATALPSFGPITAWSGLGGYQNAARLAVGGGDHTLHRGLLPLFDSIEAQPLLETLEVYLDAAGNAQSTAEVLHLHRTSLYYRLQRLEKLAETDLKDGMERLALHLTLKVARLTGRYSPQGTPVTGPSPRSAAVRRLSRAASSRVSGPLPAHVAT